MLQLPSGQKAGVFAAELWGCVAVTRSSSLKATASASHPTVGMRRFTFLLSVVPSVIVLLCVCTAIALICQMVWLFALACMGWALKANTMEGILMDGVHEQTLLA